MSGATIQDTDSATVQIASSQLVVTKTLRGIGTCAAALPATSARPGDTLVYDIEVRNLSTTAALTDVSVLDTFTGNYVNFATFTTPILPGPGTMGTLGPSALATACLTLTVPMRGAPDPFVNTVVANGTLGGVLLTDSSSASLPLGGSGALLATNLPSVATAALGDTVTYTVTLRNTGLDPIGNLQASVPGIGNLTLLTTTLSPGQSTTTTYTHTLTGLDADPYQSTVNATGMAAGAPVADSATATVDIVTPGLRITKVANPTLAVPGTPILYTITITNTGTSNLTGITVTDMLLGGDITSNFPTVSAAQPLIPGASVTASLTRTLAASDSDPVINVAAVTATTITAATLTDTTSATVNIAGSGLLVVKRANTNAALVGDVITYTVDITNTSTTQVTNLSIADSLSPSGLTLPKFTLIAGEHITTSYTHTLVASDPDPLINTVAVSGRDQLGVTVSDTSSATVAVLSNASIRATLTPDRAFVLATEAINYLATVTNIGGEALTNVTLVADLPDGSSQDLIAAAAGLSLQPGESVTRTFSYTVDPADPSPVTARITATGTGAIAGVVMDVASAPVSLTASSIDVDLRTSGCGVPCIGVVGDTINFLASLTNDGSTTLTDISLTSPQAITAANPTGELITGAPPILLPGNDTSVTFSYRVPLGANLNTVISVEASGKDPAGAIVSRTYDFILNTASPRISVVLAADRTLAAAGEIVTYTATITNVGNVDLYSIAIVDSQQGPIAADPTIARLQPNQSRIVSFTHTITGTDSDPFVNTLTVSGITSFGRSVMDNDSLAVNVLRPELFVTAVADRTVATVGDNINYLVTVLNIGDGPITNLRGNYIVADLSSTGGQQRPALQGGVVQLNLDSTGTLPAGIGITGTFSHVVTSSDANPLTFRVTITGDGLVGATSMVVSDDALVSTPLITVDQFGNPIVVGTPIPGTADPEVTKTTDQPFAVPGGLITWLVTVRNPGTDPLSGLIVTDTLESTMTLESVTITNGTIQSEGNVIVATTGALEFNQSAVLTIIARVDSGVTAGQLIQNIACATSVGGAAAVCNTGTVRVSPDADLLPATGLAAPDAAGPGQGLLAAALALAGLLLLGGLLGMSVQEPQRGMRLVTILGLVAAAVIIVAVLVALVLSLGNALQPEEQAAAATATQTIAVGETLTEEATEPAATENTPSAEATAIPPTPIPIPTAVAGAAPDRRTGRTAALRPALRSRAVHPAPGAGRIGANHRRAAAQRHLGRARPGAEHRVPGRDDLGQRGGRSSRRKYGPGRAHPDHDRRTGAIPRPGPAGSWRLGLPGRERYDLRVHGVRDRRGRAG